MNKDCLSVEDQRLIIMVLRAVQIKLARFAQVSQVFRSAVPSIMQLEIDELISMHNVISRYFRDMPPEWFVADKGIGKEDYYEKLFQLTKLQLESSDPGDDEMAAWRIIQGWTEIAKDPANFGFKLNYIVETEEDVEQQHQADAQNLLEALFSLLGEASD